jgi:uncharacterized protein (TIGR03067 family)
MSRLPFRQRTALIACLAVVPALPLAPTQEKSVRPGIKQPFDNPENYFVQFEQVPMAEDQNGSVRKDPKLFQGNWSLASAQRDGKKMPQEEVEKFKLSIDGNEFVLKKESAIVSRGTFKLDPTKRPKEIDETVTTGPSQGKLFRAIYEIDDDQHTICFAAAGKDRPAVFSSEPGSGHLLQVWKRDKK